PTSPACRGSTATSLVERGLDALRGDPPHDALVLGGVDGLGLVDEHDRDVVADQVLAGEARVVEEVLVLKVVKGSLVLGAREDLEQEGVERHGQPFFRSSSVCR